ncbi:MAG: dipeptidase [Bacteroidales bacterium]
MKKNALLLLLATAMISCTQKEPKDFMTIHNAVYTIDSHTDTPLRFVRSEFHFGERHDPVKDRSCVDLPRMEEGGLDGVFLAVFLGQREMTTEGYKTAWDYSMRILDSIYAVADRYGHRAGIALSPEDGLRLEKENKRSLFIGIENGYPVGTDLGNIQTFYQRGARYITLCHTRNNQICDSSTDTTLHNGLSDFGVEMVKEMNRLGMMIDVSHISDSSFYDVIRISEAPVIASHSCARTICDNPRNLTDSMLRTLAGNNGVIQLCILSNYVKEREPNHLRDSLQQTVRKKYRYFKDLTEEEWKSARKEWYAIDSIAPRKLATIADAVDHIDHIVEVAGIDHVGIGTDFDGGGGLADCRDVSQLPNITKELVDRGYTEEDVRKIWGGNLLRVMEAVKQQRESRDP